MTETVISTIKIALITIAGLVKAQEDFFINNFNRTMNIPVCKIKKAQGSVPANAKGIKNIKIINSMYEKFGIRNFTNIF